MKLRHLAVSLAAAATLSIPAFAQDVVVVPVTPPDAVIPPNTSTVVVVPPTATPESPSVIILDSRQRDIVTEPGGMTPRERADTAGTLDPATGTLTAPGYQGPRSTKGQ